MFCGALCGVSRAALHSSEDPGLGAPGHRQLTIPGTTSIQCCCTARVTHYANHSLGSIAMVLSPRALLKLPSSKPPIESIKEQLARSGRAADPCPGAHVGVLGSQG